MKKIILLILILFFAVNKINSQAITFGAPKESSKFSESEKITVTWDINEKEFKDLKEDKFILVKRNKDSWDSVTTLTLAELKERILILNSDGKFGEGTFQIGFKELNSKLPFSYSKGTFKIEAAKETPKNPKITFISPKKLDTLKVGQSYEIKWDYKDAEDYEDSQIYFWLSTAGMERTKNFNNSNSLMLTSLKPIYLKDKSFFLTISDKSFKKFEKGTGVLVMDFDILKKIPVAKDPSDKDTDTKYEVVKNPFYSYSPEFKLFGDKYIEEKNIEVGLSLKGSFVNSSTLSQSSNSSATGGLILYGQQYSANLLGSRIPLFIFSGELNIISTGAKDSAVSDNFGSSILDLEGNLSFGVNLLRRFFLGSNSDFFRNVGFFMSVGFDHQNWLPKDTASTIKYSPISVSAAAVDLGVQYDIFGQLNDTTTKKNDLRLSAFAGLSIRKIFGDITAEENVKQLNLTWGTTKTFYVGPHLGLKIEYKDIALSGRFYFFDRDGVKEVPGFTNGQLVTKFTIKTNLLKGFFNL